MSSWSGSVALSVQVLAKQWKTERLWKLVEEKQVGSVSLQVASWFAAAVMERCNGKLAAALRLAFVNDFEIKECVFTVGSLTDLAWKTSSCFHLAVFAITSSVDSSGGELLSGHVLGLRIEQAKVAVTFCFLVPVGGSRCDSTFLCGASACQRPRWWCSSTQQLHFEYMDEHPGVCVEVSEHASQAKATARVDVAETPMVNRRGQGVELVKMNLKGKEEKSFPVFLRTLQGRHHVLSCTAGMLLADLHEQVANKCHMPCDKFVLVHRSMIVQGPGSLGEWGIERDVMLSLSARLLGGSGIPWRVALCLMQSGWVLAHQSKVLPVRNKPCGK